MDNFYKLANPDGFDFYTGKTINYRDNVGKTVTCPNYNKEGELCSDAFIHASREPEQCFVGAKIPCSAYLVSGRVVKEDKDKCGFKNLKILEELKPEKLFKWRYSEACNPLDPRKITPPEISDKEIELLKQWYSVRHNSVWDSVGHGVRHNSVWGSVWYSIWDSVGHGVRHNSVWGSVGRSVWGSVWGSIWDSVWYSIWDSVGAYIGYIFQPAIPLWQKEYPYQCAVDLLKLGLVPSFDGSVWRLHGGEDMKVLWEGSIKTI